MLERPWFDNNMLVHGTACMVQPRRSTLDVVSGGLGYFCTHVSYVVLLVCTKNVEDGWDDSVVD